MIMKGVLAILCIALAMLTASSALSETREIDLYQMRNGFSSHNFSTHDSDFPIDFAWIIERYDFERAEKYIDEYYGTYHRYLANTQQELASKFGLSDIFLKPNFKEYEDTKLVFTKKIWSDKLTLRYLAPVGDIRDFEFFVAFRPCSFLKFTVRSQINGESNISAALNWTFGGSNEKDMKDSIKRTRKILAKMAGVEI